MSECAGHCGRTHVSQICCAHWRTKLQQQHLCAAKLQRLTGFIDVWSDEHICQQSGASRKHTEGYNPEAVEKHRYVCVQQVHS